MIGQMLIMGFAGYDVDEHSPVTEWIQRDAIGGVLLFDYDFPNQQFGKNLKNKTQIKSLNEKLYKYSLQANDDKECLPLFIALDYEGGDIDRLKYIDDCVQTIPPVMQAKLSDDALLQEARIMAHTLKSLGFNLNFAPVVDLNLNDQVGIIGKRGRSFSNDPIEVIRAANQFVKAFKEHDIVCCYKHFPGHGSALGDTHEGFVDVTDTFDSKELIPYEVLLKERNAPIMVMTAHVVNHHLDNTGLPATLSYPILTGLLRNKLQYEGIIISDDLQMHAISNHYQLSEALARTINAGADMLIFGNQLGQINAPEVIDCIEALVESGEVQRSRVEESFQRIHHFKKKHITVDKSFELNLA